MPPKASSSKVRHILLCYQHIFSAFSDGEKTAVPTGASPRRIPTDLTCLVRYESLDPNYGEQAIRKGTKGNRYWAPPNKKNAYHRNRRPPQWFRWSGGRMAQISAVDNGNRQALQEHSVATIFTQQPDTDHFLAVPFDAEKRDVVEVYGGWKTLSFNHIYNPGTNTTCSAIDLAGESQRLAAPGSNAWLPQLVPHIYNFDANFAASQAPSGGLTGSLPILFALPAFSAQPGRLVQVLEGHLRPNQWIPHNYQHGCNGERGMVVTVYVDPHKKEASSIPLLNALASGHWGPFYQP